MAYFCTYFSWLIFFLLIIRLCTALNVVKDVLRVEDAQDKDQKEAKIDDSGCPNDQDLKPVSKVNLAFLS